MSSQIPVDICGKFSNLFQTREALLYVFSYVVGMSFCTTVTTFSTANLLPLLSYYSGRNIGQGYIVLKEGDRPDLYNDPDDILTDPTANVLKYGQLISSMVAFLLNVITLYFVFKVFCVCRTMKQRIIPDKSSDRSIVS